MSRYDDTKQCYNAYSTALRVGFALLDLAMVVKNAYIRVQNRAGIAKVDDFIHNDEN